MQDTTIRLPLLHPQTLSIIAITWNLFGSLPPVNSLVELFQSKHMRPKPDVILFGTQQCQRSLTVSLCCQAKDEWENMLRQVLPQYELIGSETMVGLHSAVLVKKPLDKQFKIFRKSNLKAGTCNLLGNKGAINIQITFFGQLLQFINCHLEAHQNQSDRRNYTILRIIEMMVRKQSRAQSIFLGDFNYRIDMPKEQYELMTKDKDNTNEAMRYTSMVNKQQLYKQKILQQLFFDKFQQGPIHFPPTYKLGLDKNEYNKKRIPGWTDRIFHKHTSRKLKRISYQCEYNIMGCDHRPVLASYQLYINPNDLGWIRQSAPAQEESCQII